MTMGFGQWERGRAESAFGAKPADDPMTSAATGAVVDLAFAINGMIAAHVRIELPPANGKRTQHGCFLSNIYDSNDQRFDMFPKGLPRRADCHPPRRDCAVPGRLWILTIS